MKKSLNQDVSKLKSIAKNITRINKFFDRLGIKNERDFAEDELAQMSCALCLANIHNDKEQLREETKNKLLLNEIDLRAIRNITSHDYENLVQSIVFKRCVRVTKPDVLSNIYDVISLLEQDEGRDGVD